MSDEEYTEAKTDLDRAIKAFYAATEPDVYIDAWALSTHKLSSHLEQSGSTALGLLTPNGQSFVMTAGLLEVARRI